MAQSCTAAFKPHTATSLSLNACNAFQEQHHAQRYRQIGAIAAVRSIEREASDILPSGFLAALGSRIVRDGDKQALAYVYYENESGRRSSAKLLTRDEAFLIAVNIAKLPSVPRQILKDIPRPPNSASRDD